MAARIVTSHLPAVNDVCACWYQTTVLRPGCAFPARPVTALAGIVP